MPELLLVGDQDILLISVSLLPVLLDLIDEEADGVTSPSPYLGWISELVHEPGLLLPEGGGHGLALLSVVDDDDDADSAAVAEDDGGGHSDFGNLAGSADSLCPGVCWVDELLPGPVLLVPGGGGHGLALLSRVGFDAATDIVVDDAHDDDDNER